MKFCPTHWEALRQAIFDRGLAGLIPEGGEAAAKAMVSQMEEGETTIDNFDPLMAAHNMIWSNAMSYASESGMNALAMLDGNQPPEVQCPVCFLNGSSDYHDEHCKDPDCKRPKGYRFDWMITRAADDVLQAWRDMSTL